VTDTYLDVALKQAKVFEMDKVKKRMMLLTDDVSDKNLLSGIKMPFPSVFIDIDITQEELPEFSTNSQNFLSGDSWDKQNVEKISGILLFRINTYDPGHENWEMDDVILSEFEAANKFGFVSDTNMVAFMAVGVISKSGDFQIQTFYLDLKDSNIKYEYFGNLPVVRFLAGFVRKFLLFVEYPEVEIIHRKRSESNKKRRAREGKPILPDSNFIKLTGKLKIYEDKYYSELNSDGFNFRFWVRGHFRHLRADRYKNKKTIWVEPFIKGKGELRDKKYYAEATNGEKKGYKNYLFYDDIEPAQKPLSEVRR